MCGEVVCTHTHRHTQEEPVLEENSRLRGVRLRGRPQTGWMDGMRRALNERGMCGAKKDDCV